VTSARWSERLGKAIGMAWVPARLAEEAAAFEIRVDGRLDDPEGERPRS
jgi:glycine cleavage system aminomethyltransferase T